LTVDEAAKWKPIRDSNQQAIFYLEWASQFLGSDAIARNSCLGAVKGS